MTYLIVLLVKLSLSYIEIETAFESHLQKDSLYFITEVTFKNNKKTKDSYLLRVLDLEIPSQHDVSEVEERVKAIRNVSGIFHTNYSLIKTSETNYRLDIYIEEQKTVLPIVALGIQPTNKWFQIGVVDINFLGRGDHLVAYYQNNQGRHSGEVYYKKNNVSLSNFGYYVNALLWQTIDPLNFPDNQRFNYFYTNQSAGAGLHYNNNRGIELSTGVSYFNENYEREIQGINLPGPSELSLNKVLSTLSGGYSNLIYEGIYKERLELKGNYTNVYTMETNQIFHSTQIEAKYFMRVSKRNQLASRLSCAIASNFDSPFAPFVIDSYQNVRGAGDRISRGTAIASYNLEWRYEIDEIKKIVLQSVLFTDGSFLRIPDELNQSHGNTASRVSVGAGLRMNYTKIYDASLRLDLAYEILSSRTQVVAGIGQFF